MTLGEYIKDRRTELNMSRNLLAQKADISHTEVHRIEAGDRKLPSLKVLCALADALNMPQEDFLKVAGYSPSVDSSAAEKAFTGLQRPKQIETIERIEQHKNAGNARFCEKCGQPTHFFKAKILKPFNEVREAFVGEYLQVNPFAIRAGQALTVGNTSASVSEDNDGELPF